MLMNYNSDNPNMIRCRKCHKWYDRTKVRCAKADWHLHDDDIDYDYTQTFTRYYCPFCGYWP